jgi:hypothetical protein
LCYCRLLIEEKAETRAKKTWLIPERRWSARTAAYFHRTTKKRRAKVAFVTTVAIAFAMAFQLVHFQNKNCNISFNVYQVAFAIAFARGTMVFTVVDGALANVSPTITHFVLVRRPWSCCVSFWRGVVEYCLGVMPSASVSLRLFLATLCFFFLALGQRPHRCCVCFETRLIKNAVSRRDALEVAAFCLARGDHDAAFLLLGLRATPLASLRLF